MDFFQRLRAGLARLMYGRYGADQFGRFILYASMALLFLTFITGLAPLWYLSIAGYAWGLFRMFSRNLQKRGHENEVYLQKKTRLFTEIRQARVRFRNRKQFKYFRCPQCRARLRLTRGCGEKTVTCQNCKHTFKTRA
ncbi:MAG: hypothetical protein IJS53_05200 [Clostridia bacterium]|nr:hypothetical protein [Clostridia bacterium]